MSQIADINKYDDKYNIDLFEINERDCRTYNTNLKEEFKTLLEQAKPPALS